MDGDDTRSPTGFADVLRAVAGHLDASDATLEAVADRLGEQFDAGGDQVQTDLRAAADWFDTHPDADAAAFDAVPSLAGWTVPADYLGPVMSQ